MEKRPGRPQLVSDEDIRATALALLGEGVKPVVAKVRAKLIESTGHGGEPARITRVVSALTKSLAQAPQGPLTNPDIPKELLKPAGDLVVQMFALANEQAMKSGEAYREEVEKAAAMAVDQAEAAAEALLQANATLEGRLIASSQKATEMEAIQAGLATRVEQLTTELAAMNATLKAERQARKNEKEALNRRTLELEEALKAKIPQPAIDMDVLIERITQATKGNIS